MFLKWFAIPLLFVVSILLLLGSQPSAYGWLALTFFMAALFYALQIFKRHDNAYLKRLGIVTLVWFTRIAIPAFSIVAGLEAYFNPFAWIKFAVWTWLLLDIWPDSLKPMYKLEYELGRSIT